MKLLLQLFLTCGSVDFNIKEKFYSLEFNSEVIDLGSVKKKCYIKENLKLRNIK